MKLKFTLRGQGDTDTDLVATVDGTTTVGQLADFLVRADPSRSAVPGGSDSLGDFTFSHVDEDFRAVDPRSTLAESGIRSGAHLAVTRRTGGYADRGSAVATAVVVAGPDEGREYPLSAGTAYIGRGRGCEIRVSDPQVSRRHARLLVTDILEVIDLGSSNGIDVQGQQVDRAVLRSGDRFRLGDTEIEVRVAGGTTGLAPGRGTSVPFSRSPRIAPLYTGTKFPVPELPERPKPERPPWLTAFIPAIMGVALVAITRNPLFGLFILLTPLMLFGHYWESKRHARLDYEDAMKDFREDLGFMIEELQTEQEVEVEGRQAEHPAATETVEAASAGSALLWTRRAGDPGFAEFRLGLGSMPSRNYLEVPQLGRSRAEAWLEASKALEGLGEVSPVPVVAEPLRAGAIGVAGPREQTLAAARSIVAQAVGLHSPAELVVATLASPSSARDWDWLKWVPHTASPHSPIEAKHLANTGPGCAALLTELEDLVSEPVEAETREEDAGPRQGDFVPPKMPKDRPVVLVVIEDDAPVERSRMVQIAEEGWRRGVIVLWLAPATVRLPAACRIFLEQGTAPDDAVAGFVGEAVVRMPVTADALAAADTARMARALAPLVDSGVPVEDESDLPRSVSFLTLVGTEIAESHESVIERWGENRSIITGPYAAAPVARPKPGNLRAVIGQSAGGTFSIDLKSDGPHALVGGTTGAGKSELLQAWILGMAVAHSPQRLTFLLVDYKGGSAFRDCVNLPHTVGLVTDLSQHLVRRALASLSAELKYREHILAQYKAKDLAELERRGEAAAPPSLVIVVDEFAALVQEVPEFVDGVVNVAQRGRSLGLHLILATQRPAGVIKDNLRANTNLRMALRMADEADSEDVLGTNVAAFFDPSLPGRAVSKAGPGRLTPFQTGYAGGWTTGEAPPAQLEVETLGFGSGVPWELPVVEEHVTVQDDLGPTDIQRVVTQVEAARVGAQIDIPRKPWLPELAATYELADLPTKRRDDELVIGISDDPDNQTQPPISFRPDVEGNLAVYGASGSGKSAFLRTVAVAAGFTVRGGPCRVYGLDFGNRGLAMLEDLPHVGSIIYAGDHERFARLLTMLREMVDERAVRYSKVNATTITDYRRLTGETDEPRVIVLVDGLAALAGAYDDYAGQKWLDLLTSLASDGRPVGLHFVVTADSRSGVWGSLASAVQSRLVMRMANPDDYIALDVPGDVLSLGSAPGRALKGDRELQIAVLGGSSDSTVQARAIAGFAEGMRRAGAQDVPSIESLAEKIRLADLPARDEAGRPVIGVLSSTLEPVGFDLRGGQLVVGPSGSGRTTTVLTMVQAAKRAKPGLRTYLFSPRPSALTRTEGVWTDCAVGASACQELAERLRPEITEAGPEGATVLVVVERAQDLDGTEAEDALIELTKTVVQSEQALIGEADTTFFNSNYGLPYSFKIARSGVSLQASGDESMVFASDYRGLSQSQKLDGRGYLVRRGTPELLQVALPLGTDAGEVAGT